MCGISGVVCRNGSTNQNTILKLQNSLQHRGPDAQTLYRSGPVTLCHNRLSVIDLETANQPLFSKNKNLCLVANGEIYNFKEIRRDYSSKGYEFETNNSDCEVILPLYEEFGKSCVEYIRGMFAFAIWDEEKRQLILARDRMGEKPLYFFINENSFVFSSELRSIASCELVNPILDQKQLARYFRFKYIPEPNTPFRNISKLPAGSILVLNIDDWTYEVQTYWSAWDAKPIHDDPVKCIRSSLEDAVRTCSPADVTMGLSLSGGIDSSILACLLSEILNDPLHVFSVGYPGNVEVDERSQARELAERLGLKYHDVELTDQYIVSSFEELVKSRNDPISDIAGFSYLAIMQQARDHGVKVMFQGHGLDELCWGYPWTQQAVFSNEGRWVNKDIHGFRAFRKKHTEKMKWVFLNIFDKDRRIKMFESHPATYFVDTYYSKYFSSDFVNETSSLFLNPTAEYGRRTNRSDLDVTRLIVEYYLLENGIAQGDRISMANSIEMRLPFVDYRLVETIVGLRKKVRDDHLPPKYLLKESVRDLLGDDVINRPKRGFQPPAHRWYTELLKEYGGIFEGGHLRKQNIFKEEVYGKFLEPEKMCKREREFAWEALNLEMWMKTIL